MRSFSEMYAYQYRRLTGIVDLMRRGTELDFEASAMFGDVRHRPLPELNIIKHDMIELKAFYNGTCRFMQEHIRKEYAKELQNAEDLLAQIDELRE